MPLDPARRSDDFSATVRQLQAEIDSMRMQLKAAGKDADVPMEHPGLNTALRKIAKLETERFQLVASHEAMVSRLAVKEARLQGVEAELAEVRVGSATAPTEVEAAE